MLFPLNLKFLNLHKQINQQKLTNQYAVNHKTEQP
jgi:hypothetical protein